MAHRFIRQGLYELVWSKPMKTLTPRLGISDVGLAKACRPADIPVPERGYWVRSTRKDVIKRPLPARGLGMSDTVTIGEDSYCFYQLASPSLACRGRIGNQIFQAP